MKPTEQPTLIIMAAGMGSRYGGLKQVDKITDAGEIILDFSLYDAMMAGFNRAIFVIKEENREIFREMVDERAGMFIILVSDGMIGVAETIAFCLHRKMYALYMSTNRVVS